ncbi:MAG: hypothetical protein FWF51_00525 [Chitinivibrionia bacterium]|jgi:hypothetical protein|nr:hypothetical protein [Chitinivibrionia bacterium]
MNVVDIFFSSGWVTTLFVVILVNIAFKVFVLPKSYQKDRVIRIELMKRQEDRKYVQKSVYS